MVPSPAPISRKHRVKDRAVGVLKKGVSAAKTAFEKLEKSIDKL